MKPLKTRRVIEYPQLLGIAVSTLRDDPTICDTDWKEAIKRQLVRQGYTYPTDRETLGRVMDAAEHIMRRDPRDGAGDASPRRHVAVTAEQQSGRQPPTGWASGGELARSWHRAQRRTA